MRDAVFITSNLTHGIRHWSNIQYLFNTLSGMGSMLIDIVINIGLILIIAVLDLFAGEDDLVEKSQKLSADFFLLLLALLFILIMMFGVFHTGGEFIYFQF